MGFSITKYLRNCLCTLVDKKAHESLGISGWHTHMHWLVSIFTKDKKSLSLTVTFSYEGRSVWGGLNLSPLCRFSSCKLFPLLGDSSLLLEDLMRLTKEQAAAT